MMLNKGLWGREQLLSKASVEAMTRDQLTPHQHEGAEIFFGSFSSWGFGMSVDIQQDKPWHVPGRFGWDGGFGTSAYSDPENDFVGIILTQRVADSPEPAPVFTDFWKGAYNSLET
jgi:CubicO group peptidase (beta-lactamase class C family)